jgi:hypothetical protein
MPWMRRVARASSHRDPKPANIMLTKSGVKVLDFGLAKMGRPAAGREEAASEVTQAGTILGTWLYMAPEQLQGKETDGRSDLFAFGCVLYEMLTGKRAFEGESAATVIASMERNPAPLTTAPALERIVRRCLAKDPDERFQTACDLKAALTWAMEQASATPAAADSRDRQWLVAALFVSVALAGVATFGWLLPRPVQPRTVLRWTVPSLAANPGTGYGVAVSRDGARLAYAELADGPITDHAAQPEPCGGTSGCKADCRASGVYAGLTADISSRDSPAQGWTAWPLTSDLEKSWTSFPSSCNILQIGLPLPLKRHQEWRGTSSTGRTEAKWHFGPAIKQRRRVRTSMITTNTWWLCRGAIRCLWTGIAFS